MWSGVCRRGITFHASTTKCPFMHLFSRDNEKLSWSSAADWRFRIWRNLLLEKLNTNWGYTIGLGIALLVAWVVGRHDVSTGWLLLTGTIFFPALMVAFLFPRKGIIVLLAAGFFLTAAKRMSGELPLGTVVDLLLLIMSAGVILRLSAKKDWYFIRHPLSLMVGFWILYCGLEFLNPWSGAEYGWLFAFRSVAGWFLLFYISLFSIRRVRQMVILHRIWLALSILGALYGIWQWWAGPSDLEFSWILEDSRRFDLLFNGETLRAFSFFPDPSTFGIVCSLSATILLILSFRPGTSSQRKLLGIVGSILLLSGTLVSNSKIALILPVVGLVFYTLLTLRKGAIILTGSILVMWLAIILLPIEHPRWNRIQRIANPSSSIGYQLRAQNQDWIQPFIHGHPIGAGLGTTGNLGERFAPDVWLSQFPPDSAYIRIVLETGWIGLFLYLTLMGLTMWTGIRGLFRTNSPRLKAMYHAYLTFCFMVIVGSFAQQIITQLPTGLMFIILMAAMINLQRISTTSEAEIIS